MQAGLTEASADPEASLQNITSHASDFTVSVPGITFFFFLLYSALVGADGDSAIFFFTAFASGGLSQFRVVALAMGQSSARRRPSRLVLARILRGTWRLPRLHVRLLAGPRVVLHRR